MIILGIETSCDETGVAIIKGSDTSSPVELLSNSVASSLALHAATGGIIPETAAREQVKFIIPAIREALKEAKLTENDIDAIAVTYGPGLIGSLLVGVETARTLALLWRKPLIPVNHMIGHLYANFIDEVPSEELDARRYELNARIEFPALGLVVSGNHTDLLLLKKHGELEVLGGTRDDAAGEAFDKTGRLLGLSYPAGPMIAKLAAEGDPKAYRFPRPLHDSGDFDFSFSGLKTAVLREVQATKKLDDETIANIAASVQEAIVDIIVKKTLAAAKKHQVKTILLGGGVAANKHLHVTLQEALIRSESDIQLRIPSPTFCTDNGAMIAAAAFYNPVETDWRDITANPELYY